MAAAAAPDHDAIIIGAGMSGLYQLHRLRALGMRARVFEAGAGVGGTWYWNRYPGARFDSESYSYGYSFSQELLDDAIAVQARSRGVRLGELLVDPGGGDDFGSLDGLDRDDPDVAVALCVVAAHLLGSILGRVCFMEKKEAHSWAPFKRRERDLNPRSTFQRLRAFQSRSFGRSDTSPGRRHASPPRKAPGTPCRTPTAWMTAR